MKFSSILKNLIMVAAFAGATQGLAGGWQTILSGGLRVLPGSSTTGVVPVQTPVATTDLYARVYGCPNVSIVRLDYVPYGQPLIDLRATTPRGNGQYQLPAVPGAQSVGAVRFWLAFHGVLPKNCGVTVAAWQEFQPLPPAPVPAPVPAPLPVPVEDNYRIGQLDFRASNPNVSATVSFPVPQPAFAHKLRVVLDPARCVGVQILGVNAYGLDAGLPVSLTLRTGEGYSYDVNEGVGSDLTTVRLELLGGSPARICPITVVGTIYR